MTTKQKKLLVFLCTMMLIFGVTKASKATILTFEGLGLSNYGTIPGAYGDNVSSTSDATGTYLEGNGFTPNVTVEYRTVEYTVDPSTGSTLADYISYWDTGYGDLSDVGFPASEGYLGEISLVPEPGYFVVLNSFDLGGYFTVDRPNQTVRILDESFNVLVDYSPVNVEGDSGHTTFTPNISSTSTIRIQFGPSWNTGIDNVNFDQAPIEAIADFSAFPTSGQAPLEVEFTDQSTGIIDSWYWEFGDGSSSSEQNPSHIYSIPGIFDISLTVSNSSGADTETKTGYITVIPENVPELIPRVRAFWSFWFGKRIVIALQVKNIGNWRAGKFNVALHLDDPDDPNSWGELLDERTVRYGLRPGHSRTIILYYVSPNSLSGRYVGCIIDPENQILEVDKNNNTKIIWIP